MVQGFWFKRSGLRVVVGRPWAAIMKKKMEASSYSCFVVPIIGTIVFSGSILGSPYVGKYQMFMVLFISTISWVARPFQ